MDDNRIIEFISELAKQPNETEWIEFKEGNNEADRIGRDISALANSAAFLGREYAYKIWGVKDKGHELVGTSFDYLRAKAVGNQDLSIWLSKALSQNANYDFDQAISSDGKHFVLLRIAASSEQPICFKGTAYIREGSSTTKLVAGSSKEAELWRRLQRRGFAFRIAEENVCVADIRDLLDTEAYYRLLDLRIPTSTEASLLALGEQRLIKQQDDGLYSITNLGALLLARKLSSFVGLRKRALRVIRFAGKGNFDILEDNTFNEGYALSLPLAESHIMSLLSSREVANGAFRRIQYVYPQRAVRELLVNAVIHQDMTVASAGPVVSIYDNRIEFSNPGTSLIPINRMLNAQPKSRNAELAGLLRQMDLCEEGGTGLDIVVAACENAHIMTPKIVSNDETGTTVTLYADSVYRRMTKTERLEAVYWHACLMYAQGESMNNASLRERFGLDGERKNILAMSRLIKEACEKGRIKGEDEETGSRYRHYIPAWA